MRKVGGTRHIKEDRIITMTIEELITFCEEEERNHRLTCKRYDDASGYTRSKDKNIRTACAIRETTYADFYKEISDTMRKYQKIEQIAREGKNETRCEEIVRIIDGKA